MTKTKTKNKNIKEIGKNNCSNIIEISKLFAKISDESINLFIKKIIKNIWGVSAIMVAIKKSLFRSLKKIPVTFLIIYGTPGINLKII